MRSPRQLLCEVVQIAAGAPVRRSAGPQLRLSLRQCSAAGYGLHLRGAPASRCTFSPALTYKIDSHLIILRGLLNEQEPRAAHYYEMRGGQFRFIQRMPIAAGSPHPAVQSSPPAQAEALICYYDSRGVPARCRHVQDRPRSERGRQHAIAGPLSAIGRRQLHHRQFRSVPAGCRQVQPISGLRPSADRALFAECRPGD